MGDPNNLDGREAYLSIPEIISYWSSLNNCTSFTEEYLPNENNSDGSYVIKQRHYDPNKRQAIELDQKIGYIYSFSYNYNSHFFYNFRV